jgi:FtsP/CotA-like multicopper oxidase with cupredoxin domain
MTTRREFLLSAACAPLAGCALFSDTANARLTETKIGGARTILSARACDIRLISARKTRAWLYGDTLFPVLRMKHGEDLDVVLHNALSEHTSIHWHGVRAPNAMDGVPYLTQRPVQPGEDFRYRFRPPDAGTFFFHPHCNTAEQMGRGLIGALVVEDELQTDDDIVMIVKDWRLNADGGFLPFYTASGAGKAGTFGTLRTVNALPAPTFATPPNALVRLRVINADPTRILELGLDGATTTVIAIDGNRISPFAMETWRLGPAMRIDLLLHTARQSIRLLDYFADSPVVLATIDTSGTPAGPATSNVAAGPMPGSGFGGARREILELGAGAQQPEISTFDPVLLPDGTTIDLADSLCLAQETFWTLNGKAWPTREHSRLPPPLFTFERGEAVIFDISNTTSRAHPIHIHGHTMTLLSASLLKRPIHRADTVLVLPNERVSVGFVADNPGNWMIHCHVIEHQETGMMGWFRVT